MSAPAPVLLAPPQTLHEADGLLIWHSAVVLGPNADVVTGLEVMSTDGRNFLEDPAWGLTTGAGHPILSQIRFPDGRQIPGWSSVNTSKHSVYETIRFRRLGPEIPGGAVLQIAIFPLDLNFTIDF